MPSAAIPSAARGSQIVRTALRCDAPVLLFLSQSLAWLGDEQGRTKAVPTAENTERLIISLSRRERLCARANPRSGRFW